MILEVKNISKYYYEYERFLKRFFSWFGIDNNQKKLTILNDINFKVKSGESIGLIGVNGAGKSTLLKIISNTLKPSSGTIKLNGKIASILELGMGFYGDLTGRENAYNACALYGYSKNKIDKLISYIQDFAEIGEYFDMPVRIYSSGMQIRLAFAVVTASRPDILIIDEALSVGDTYFQHKSFDRILEFKKLGTTLIIVSHDSAAIKTICDRVILLDKGNILKDGKPSDVLDYYNALISKKENEQIIQKNRSGNQVLTISGNSKANITSIKILNSQNKELKLVNIGEKIRLKISVLANLDLDSLVCGFQIKDRFSQIVYGTNSFFLDKILKNVPKNEKIDFNFEFVANLGVGSYSISVAIHSNQNHIGDNYEWIDNAVIFQIQNISNKPEFIGLAFLDTILNTEKADG
ncbi:ABC transporter [Campylobacter sputorum subsp. bubulus]|uniref:ABC transporter n=1 Tax=Campylobacter sputorum subsp. sputorum TaxID=32024 RepID=A0A381DJD8_9BACT|nr:ABC transporter ATP-binding protein [Campylobacter sputorum]ASM35806.1 polysaccharide/polyol phosphate ABC transporter, ATP-binding protein [Campylobacter sputorum aubsp. sputorum RM3237]KAB0581514.1 ABC transporter ATP-binding protein [Campylobacter sputorum subsp. sputorum]QEL05996.1 polysaccharide/polyol phosphate ABC transporter, ATP-binding protein [Campylobacter sputorum subsp. sputorum]SUX09097.1 ABC transporter [Campylobacter sputorum subsp. bubulus]SUX10788.1 ABC transporter [Campy